MTVHHTLARARAALRASWPFLAGATLGIAGVWALATDALHALADVALPLGGAA